MRAYIGFCLAMLFVTAAFAQPSNPCDPKYHWITPSDCTTVAGKMINAIANFRGALAEESERIAQARKQFWATYPNKPGAAAAHEEFAYRLYWKDMYYIYASVALPTLDSDRRNPVGSRQALEILGGQLDNGIRKSAGPDFEDWVTEVKQNMGDDPLPAPIANEQRRCEESSGFPSAILEGRAGQPEEIRCVLDRARLGGIRRRGP